MKTEIKKAQLTKVKKAITVQNNTKKTLTKTTRKKVELNKIPDKSTATQGNEGCI